MRKQIDVPCIIYYTIVIDTEKTTEEIVDEIMAYDNLNDYCNENDVDYSDSEESVPSYNLPISVEEKIYVYELDDDDELLTF